MSLWAQRKTPKARNSSVHLPIYLVSKGVLRVSNFGESREGIFVVLYVSLHRPVHPTDTKTVDPDVI